jgi:lipopolysaccharide transport system permease protein
MWGAIFMKFSLNTIRQSSNWHNSNETPVTIMRPSKGWQFVNFRELIEYRDLFFFLVWRDVKAFYAQTILGFSWAILQPLIQIVLFTIIFGKVARVSTEGIPYFLFSTVAIIPWTYMSQAMSSSSQSLIAGKAMLGKIYFPRLIFPITPVLTKLVDFSISILVVIGVMLYYRVLPTWNLLFLPLFFVYMISIPAGIGMWLSSLAIRFRDVKHAMPFLMRMMIYTAPIVYSANKIPDSYRILYSLNPIVGVIEGFRACLLGQPIPWPFIWPGMIAASLLLISGALYFKRMEWVFVDVI